MEVSSCSGLPGIISCLYVPFYFDPIISCGAFVLYFQCYISGFGVLFFRLVLSVGFPVRFYVASYMYWRSCRRSFIMCPGGVSCYTFFLGWGAGGYEAWARGAAHTLRVLVSLMSFLCYVSGRCFLLYFLFWGW